MNQQTQAIRARLAEHEEPKPQLSAHALLRAEIAQIETRLGKAHNRSAEIQRVFDDWTRSGRHTMPMEDVPAFAQKFAVLRAERQLLEEIILGCSIKLERLQLDLQGAGPEKPDQRVLDYRYLRNQYADLFAYANALGSSTVKMNTAEGRAELDAVNARIAVIGKELVQYDDIARQYDAQLRQAEENMGARRD
jgi:hypothetical protein